ncbi:MAG: hypothetical protein IPJ34_27510 [Myxococcales bacterium]|nr:hypothetical protein [Myxococcales bacterium]
MADRTAWLALLVLAGCAHKNDPGTTADTGVVDAALVPTVVGKACASDGACEGLTCVTKVHRDCAGPIRPHPFDLEFPGGYCNPLLVPEKGDIPSGCPAGSTTYTLLAGCDGIPFRFCGKLCHTDGDCRLAEGYHCQPELGLCVPPALYSPPVDAGAD